MYLDRQTPPKTLDQSHFQRRGVVNHVSGLKRKGCPGTLSLTPALRATVSGSRLGLPSRARFAGYGLGLAPGGTVLSVPGRCSTKQTGDMVYRMAKNSWLSRLRLGA